MTQTSIDGPPVEPIVMNDDPGLVSIELCGKTDKVSPSEELHKIGLLIDNARIDEKDKRGGERIMLIVRDYLNQKYGIIVSADFAARYYRNLEEADRKIADFFGLTVKSPSTTDSTAEDGDEEENGLSTPTSNAFVPPSL